MFRKKQVLLPLGFLLIWIVLSFIINNPFVLPGPVSVFMVLLHPFQDLLGSGTMISHAESSLFRVFMGFILAAAVAIPVGIFAGWSASVNEIVNPLVQILRPVPPIAWMPLAIGFLMIGTASTIFIIFMGAVFPLFMNVADGVRSVRILWIEVAQSLGATRNEIVKSIILPASMPGIWTGLRVAFGIAWMCVVAAEMLPGTSSGLGYLIMYAYNLGQIQVIIAGIFVIGIIGICVDTIFRVTGEKYFAWRTLDR